MRKTSRFVILRQRYILKNKKNLGFIYLKERTLRITLL